MHVCSSNIMFPTSVTRQHTLTICTMTTMAEYTGLDRTLGPPGTGFSAHFGSHFHQAWAASTTLGSDRMSCRKAKASSV